MSVPCYVTKIMDISGGFDERIGRDCCDSRERRLMLTCLDISKLKKKIMEKNLECRIRDLICKISGFASEI